MVFLPAHRRAACVRLSDIAFTLLAILAIGALVPACGGNSHNHNTGSNNKASVRQPAHAASSTAQPDPQAPRDCTVTFEGDSILHGGYAANRRFDEPPAAMLKRLRPAYTVIDNSEPGATATRRAPAFSTAPLTTHFVVLQHGINDAMSGQPYEPALRRMVAHVQAEGRTPVITGLSRQPLTATGRDEADAIARRVAGETGALFADWGAVTFKPAEMADVLHPAPAYSERLVGRIVLMLDKAAPECRA
ncbi:SGNH/GDSL hydrolase family protein [Variovorax sp. 375MFSha3.1]|uniref:SGNH/GDSL hydrolase family protein n=1 Tax=unclassified Variovorax TaxID=663243 RepID=UPI003AAE9F93